MTGAGLRAPGGGIWRRLPGLALLVAIAALVLLAVAPFGWRAGLWHYRVGTQTLLPWAGYCGLAAAAIALVGIAAGWRLGSTRHVAIALAALIVGGAVASVPWHYDRMRGTFAPINDITTDPDNPPAFVAAVAARRADGAAVDYGGAKTAEQQRRYYPDIAPVMLELPPAQAFARAVAAAERSGLTITTMNPAEGRIEAYQRSRWFGFTDDVVVRVAAAGSGSRVDIRSASRFGRGDFGVNAARLRRYIAALRDGS